MKFNINKHTWLGYPIFAILFIVTSVNILMASQDQFRDLFAKQNQVKTVEEQVANLREKVNVLESLDLSSSGTDLELLASAVPPTRQVWSMILGIRQAAVDANVVLGSYRVSVGDVRLATSSATPSVNDVALRITAAFEATELTQITSLSRQLYGMRPLLRVTSIRFTPGKADLVIEGAWSPWGALATDVNAPIPDYKTAVSEATPLISDLLNAATLSVGDGTEAEAPVDPTGLF